MMYLCKDSRTLKVLGVSQYPVDGQVCEVITEAEGQNWRNFGAVDPLVGAKNYKLQELSAACSADIMTGFSSSALGEPHHYAAELENQINLIGAIAFDLPIPYTCTNSAGVKVPRVHTQDQMRQVFLDGVARKTELIARFHALKALVQEASSSQMLSQISW